MSIETYKKVTYWPMNFFAICFLYVYCAVNFHFEVAEKAPFLFSIADTVIWMVFILDFLLMLILTEQKRAFFKSHLPNLLVVLVPFLRVLRVSLLILFLVNVLGNIKNRILVSIPIYTSLATTLFVIIGAASVYDAEYTAEGANIKTREDALWWAVVTIFTVGYGDRFPVTSEGRLYGVGLMACGIAVVGTVTASFAGWLITQIREVENENKIILQKLDEIQQILESK